MSPPETPRTNFGFPHEEIAHVQLVGITGALFGIVLWLLLVSMSRLTVGLAGPAVGLTERPQSPVESWRRDRALGLWVGFRVGFVLATGFAFWYYILGLGAGAAIRNFFVILFVVWPLYGIMSSVTWPTTLAWLQLQFLRHVPAVGLMPFLEDARNRKVLRTAGAAYQFRQTTLQDHLAGQFTETPATSPTA